MAEATGISWCDSTFNPWKICNPVGPGCKNCYAAALSKRFGWGDYAPGVPRQRTSAANWKLPLRWNRTPFYTCERCGYRGDNVIRELEVTGWTACPDCTGKTVLARRRVFCASLADWLDNEAPIEWLVDFLDLVRRTPNLDWLLLTKRIGNWRSRVDAAANRAVELKHDDLAEWLVNWLEGTPPANVWLGATVVNQDEANRDVPKLLAVQARVRFLSVEPMLGSIDLNQCLPTFYCETCKTDYSALSIHAIDRPHGLHWVIVGGESGPHARPMHPAWARELRDQCATAGVPLHFKQWGEWLGLDHRSPCIAVDPDGGLKARVDGKDYKREKVIGWTEPGDHRLTAVSVRVGGEIAGRLLDGVEHNGFPS